MHKTKVGQHLQKSCCGSNVLLAGILDNAEINIGSDVLLSLSVRTHDCSVQSTASNKDRRT